MKGIHATLAALLLGCGAYAPGVGAAELPAFDVVARDGRLLPERLEVPAGVKLKINVRNEGRVPVEFESTELRIEKVLAGGASSFVVIHPLKPGSYTFVDEFHEDTGRMQLIAK
ncbi:MAG TPA: cupredoxin domain-containing protein [Rhizomicrobium sp.]|nr:cupredoxin domain-containing protein [Rhizomicrobium sp.]